jgi:DNA invertase Pin-like site-specific DNA recombinase
MTERNPTSTPSDVRPATRSSKIQPRHLDKLAVVYIRQSTPQQVRENRESRDRQYALADHATTLGWARDRVLVIDDDQGQSGRSAALRPGFQRLLAEVTLGHVGLVLGLEMSRFARSSADWHRLLELCAVCGSLLADQDGVYDPTEPNDRLLLGLKGTLSEAEVFTLQNRLDRGRQNKAARGELFCGLPTGYVRLPSAEVAMDSDEQVRGVVRLVFEKFDEVGTGRGVLRHLIGAGIRIGIRPRCGPQRGELVWRRPTRSTIERILRHPIYAGAYAYGRHRYAPKVPGVTRPVCQEVSLDQIPVLLRDRLPAYISWDQFQANQAKLKGNRSGPGTPGAVRSGAGLLGGLIRCGTCGRRMSVRYPGTTRRSGYHCDLHVAEIREQTCYGTAARPIDDVVTAQVLGALEPAALELSLRASEDIAQERERLDRYRRQECERARHDAEQAERCYRAVDPTNRLVARTLEQRWEAALVRVRQADEEYHRFTTQAPPVLTDPDRQRIRALATDLPSLWSAPGVTAADRKHVIRCLVERVVVAVKSDTEVVGVTIEWCGGQVTRHTTARPVSQYEQMAEYARLVEIVRTRHAAGDTPTRIAEQLNAAGFRTPRRRGRFTRERVHELFRRFGLNCGRARVPELAAGERWLSDLATALGMSALTVRRWVARRWVRARRVPGRRGWVVWTDPKELERLRALAAAIAVGTTGYPPELTTPGVRAS